MLLIFSVFFSLLFSRRKWWGVEWGKAGECCWDDKANLAIFMANEKQEREALSELGKPW
ncbi:unnamed protein product [Malus baccata var. baccata]